MIGLSYGDTLDRFSTIPERDRQTDGQMDRIATSISRVGIAVLARDKNAGPSGERSARTSKFLCAKKIPCFLELHPEAIF